MDLTSLHSKIALLLCADKTHVIVAHRLRVLNVDDAVKEAIEAHKQNEVVTVSKVGSQETVEEKPEPTAGIITVATTINNKFKVPVESISLFLITIEYVLLCSTNCFIVHYLPELGSNLIDCTELSVRNFLT